MRKIRYIFLLALATGTLFFTGCLKNSSQIQGPAGATGPAGAPGGNFLAPHTFVLLNSLSLQGSSPIYSYKWVFSGYDSATTYMLSAYAAKVNSLGQTPIWNKLPYSNIYQPSDELLAYLTRDTVTVSYYNSSSSWPADSTVECTIIIIPQPK